MRWGPQCLPGFLPVFSVDTMEEAERLVVLACPRGEDGHYYSRELGQQQDLETLFAFGEKLNEYHEHLKKMGNCTCKPLPHQERKSCRKPRKRTARNG